MVFLARYEQTYSSRDLWALLLLEGNNETLIAATHLSEVVDAWEENAKKNGDVFVREKSVSEIRELITQVARDMRVS